jgi:putative FmdB family regulatory protein
MPLYEYTCPSCGHTWEELQSITAEPIDTCPKCSEHTAQRLISTGTNFVLKGSGWAADLYSSRKD